MPGALGEDADQGRGTRRRRSRLYAPRTIFNRTIIPGRAASPRRTGPSSGARHRQGHRDHDQRRRAAMCSGAVRAHFRSTTRCPTPPLVADGPGRTARQGVGHRIDRGRQRHRRRGCQLGTDQADRRTGLRGIHRSMKDGKDALSSMTPTQIMAMSALARPRRSWCRSCGMQGQRAGAVQPDHQQRPRPAHHALLERRRDGRHLPAVDPDQRDGAQHHVHFRTTARWASGRSAAVARCRAQRLLTHPTTRSPRWRRPPASEPPSRSGVSAGRCGRGRRRRRGRGAAGGSR